ncbi:hypothetical protein QVD17_41557 [Tagetes erecta]|uniref:RNA-directed DNA polymerase, eukaryota, reverse transcriptase zinc-binding domain protein n=1 Tax=Tagetes erecta TaxID=13708 RepID=A0AAD8JMC4_TARER|nr:hypothetical protein QVD17_41557 [Tagetes erecta]
MVTKVGSINMPVKQSLEPTGRVEPEQRIENESYLDKLKSAMPLENNGGRNINFSIDRDPADLSLREKEADCIRRFEVASLDEERFLKQKAKVKWLAVGDANTKFFHMSLKCRNHRNRIDVIRDSNGVMHEGGNVPIAFVNHYEAFLGVAGATSADPSPDLFTHQLDNDCAMDMVRLVTREEIKSAMFSIGDDKAPGPDGYTAAFYKKAWSIVGDDLCAAVQEFFSSGQGDCNSVRCIMKSLQLFTNLSGLIPSMQKSTAFFCHVPSHVKAAILDVLPFEEGADA